MLKVIIDRQTWFRGQGDSESKLLNAEGMMCCLGFACLAAGLKVEDIADKASPLSVTLRNDKTIDTLRLIGLIDAPVNNNQLLRVMNSDACQEAMILNDGECWSETDRETELSMLALGMGMEFEFIN